MKISIFDQNLGPRKKIDDRISERTVTPPRFSIGKSGVKVTEDSKFKISDFIKYFALICLAICLFAAGFSE